MANTEYGFTTTESDEDSSTFEKIGSDSSKKKKSGLIAVRAFEGKGSGAEAPVKEAERPWSLAGALKHEIEEKKKEKESSVDKATSEPAFEMKAEVATPEQEKEIAKDTIEQREPAVAAEIKEINPDDKDLPKVAEVSAAAAGLEEMKHELDSPEHKTAAQALDAGEKTVVDKIEAVTPEAPAPAAAPENAATQAPAAPDDEPNGPGNTTPNTGNTQPDPGNVPPTPGNAPPTPPNNPNGPPPPFNPNGPPPPYGGNFNNPPGPPPPPGPPGMPYGPGNPNTFANVPPPVQNTMNSMPAYNPNTISVDEADYRAQKAGWRGFIAGGFVGYIFGRHRGKKIGHRKAEQEFKPVKKKFESQAESLQWNIADKEARIRALAREKIESLQQAKQREKLIADLVSPANEAPVPASAEAKAVAVGAPLLAAAELYSRVASEQPGGVRREGEILISDRQREMAAKPAELRPIPQKAEKLSTKELMDVAEKIKIEGVSLKNMAELGTLNETSLRRVIGEYLEGRNVREALAREVSEREMRYEMDPRLRHALGVGGNGQSGNGMGSGGLQAAGHAAVTAVAPQLSDNGTGASPVSRKSDAQTESERELRRKQASTIAITTVAVTAAVAFLIWVTG